MHDQFGAHVTDESELVQERAGEEEPRVRDERYEYRINLVERCRTELQRVTLPGEVAVLLDPEGDAFARGLCLMLGASGSTVTFASIPAESLLVALGSKNPELAAALGKPAPKGFSWVVVVGRGAAGVALFPTAPGELN